MDKVYINDLGNYAGFNLILSEKIIGAPEPIELLVPVEGGEPLDFSEYFGDVQYTNRQIRLLFSSKEPIADQLTQYSRLLDAFNGKKVKVRFKDDPNYYYSGRLKVGDWKTEDCVGKVEITVNANPFKFKKEKTSKTFYISGTQTVTVNNMRKKVVPEITTYTEMTVKKGNVSVTLNSGTYRYPELQLDEGDNIFTITNNSYYGDNITFSYQEGGL